MDRDIGSPFKIPTASTRRRKVLRPHQPGRADAVDTKVVGQSHPPIASSEGTPLFPQMWVCNYSKAPALPFTLGAGAFLFGRPGWP